MASGDVGAYGWSLLEVVNIHALLIFLGFYKV
jgi:hypothetical protein